MDAGTGMEQEYQLVAQVGILNRTGHVDDRSATTCKPH